MIMRITWGKLRPGTWDEYEQTYRAVVVAKSRDIKGLRDRWLVQDTADQDAGFAVSLWDSLEDMRAYEQSTFYQQEILTSLQPFFVGDFKTNVCEVKYAQEAR
jgi:heme-degrading monooxygenase HmoA